MTDIKDGTDDIHYQSWENLSLVLYGVLLAEILYFLLVLEFALVSILLIFLFGILVFRRRIIDDATPKISSLRSLLTNILSAEHELEQDLPNLSDTEYDENLISLHERSEIVSDLRDIGIDGILILMFLAKNSEILCSIQSLVENVQIPKSTAYRNIKELQNKTLVTSHQTFDAPGKSYYKITEFGKSYMEDLYELLIGINSARV